MLCVVRSYSPPSFPLFSASAFRPSCLLSKSPAWACWPFELQHDGLSSTQSYSESRWHFTLQPCLSYKAMLSLR